MTNCGCVKEKRPPLSQFPGSFPRSNPPCSSSHCRDERKLAGVGTLRPGAVKNIIICFSPRLKKNERKRNLLRSPPESLGDNKARREGGTSARTGRAVAAFRCCEEYQPGDFQS
ncbi:hypothetical protein CRENBAI_004493 [Crenichthys baileyi]|uniref:Uncharacterized protein n=1 Tax=Crenichthys baileyi TaxID=28760 RepID=A0AAV9RNM6_9TELE